VSRSGEAVNVLLAPRWLPPPAITPWAAVCALKRPPFAKTAVIISLKL
jgi:hypothetical protein